MRVRGGSGLGDGIYVRAVCEHLAQMYESVTACSDYPELFDGTGIGTAPFSRQNIDRLAHYSARKTVAGTTQWDDVCDAAQIPRIPLRIAHQVQNRAMIDRLRIFADGKPMILVHGGRVPMGRTDGFGKELLPSAEAFGAVLEALHDCFLIQIGNAEQVYALDFDITLNGSTTVTDLLDLGLACDGAVGQCSYIVPLAEVFDKPLLAVWAARGMQAGVHPYVQAIKPAKILCKPTSLHVVDDWTPEKIRGVACGFRSKIRAVVGSR